MYESKLKKSTKILDMILRRVETEDEKVEDVENKYGPRPSIIIHKGTRGTPSLFLDLQGLTRN